MKKEEEKDIVETGDKLRDLPDHVYEKAIKGTVFIAIAGTITIIVAKGFEIYIESFKNPAGTFDVELDAIITITATALGGLVGVFFNRSSTEKDS